MNIARHWEGWAKSEGTNWSLVVTGDKSAIENIHIMPGEPYEYIHVYATCMYDLGRLNLIPSSHAALKLWTTENCRFSMLT